MAVKKKVKVIKHKQKPKSKTLKKKTSTKKLSKTKPKSKQKPIVNEIKLALAISKKMVEKLDVPKIEEVI